MEATQVHFARLLVGGRLAVGVPDISGWSGYLKQQLFLKKRGVGGEREFMITPSSLNVVHQLDTQQYRTTLSSTGGGKCALCFMVPHWHEYNNIHWT